MGLKYSAELGKLDRLKNDLAMKVRRGIFDLFMRECAPGPNARVADFGVSGHRDHEAHTFFERLYPHREQLTVIGRASEEAGWFAEEFPGITYLEADLRAIPRPDAYFDYGLCNAVVEHGGTREQQRALVKEVCRVSRCVVFTTPNKRFPVELHTFLPLLHWLPDGAYRKALRRLGQPYFAEVDNLNLLDAKTFLSLFPPERDNRLIRTGLPLLPSNLVCVSWARTA
ncbi:MAG TPA: class I SAM-dependent methyltransferase [Methylomirabilota bacterium]|nr:class I SAM-dependent methyltransferase [Methylomirabilota bacterium]